MITRNPSDNARQAEVIATSRELPHNAELEKSVLAVLLDGRHAVAIQKARQVVPHPLAFFQRDHRIIYQVCLELDDQGQRVDAQAVAELLSRYDFRSVLEKLRQAQMLLDVDQLDALGKDKLRALLRREVMADAAAFEDSALAAIGGFSAVADLVAIFAPAAGLDRNIALLWDYYQKRRLIARLSAISDKAYRTPDSFDKLVDEAGQAVVEIGKGSQSNQIHPIGSVVDATLDKIQYDQQNPNLGVKTGINDLDRKLMSLRPGGLYVLAARPGAGKTSLALNIVGHIAGHADNNGTVLFFSLEVDRIDLVKKLLSAEAGINFAALETGILEPHQQELLAGAAQSFKNWRLDLMDVSDLNVGTLRSIVRRRQLETNDGIKLVVIDYLQLLNGTRPDMNEYEKVSEISRVLKVLARDLRIPVMALSQMSRDSEKGQSDQPREPRLSDLRGSGTIEQDADAVMFIHHLKSDNQQAENECRKMKVIIAKNRFGPTGFTLMNFFPAKMRFSEAPPED
nr:AAA family ATPase [Planctomycetota bacterium]